MFFFNDVKLSTDLLKLVRGVSRHCSRPLNEKIYFSPLDDVHVGLGAAVSQAVQHLNA